MRTPYPAIPPLQPAGPFWLALYFRDLAEGTAQEPGGHLATTSWSACALLSNEGYAALDDATRSGMLLYAWPGTTYFDTPTARH